MKNEEKSDKFFFDVFIKEEKINKISEIKSQDKKIEKECLKI